MDDSTTFNKEPRSFNAFGRKFEFHFIPALYFHELITMVTETAKDSLQVVGNEIIFDPSAVTFTGGRFLSNKVFEILKDVIRGQNDKNFTMALDDIKLQLSPLELSEFLGLLMTDEETFKAIEVLGERLGKTAEMLAKKVDPSLAVKSTQSPLKSSESDPTSLIDSTVVTK